jgi:hypothetical protein
MNESEGKIFKEKGKEVPISLLPYGKSNNI